MHHRCDGGVHLGEAMQGFNGLGLGLGNLSRLSAARTRSISAENFADEELTVYYQIDYTITEVPDDLAYFHAQWRRSNPLPYREVHTLLDGISGSGHYVGTYLAWGVNSSGWWGEGEIKFFLDGD